MTTFVMGADLPWADESAVFDATGPFDSAVILHGGVRQDCKIRKISALGATVRARIGSTPGEDLTIELGTGQRQQATVEWLREGENGLRFRQPIDVIALINRQLVSQPAERRAMPRVEIRSAIHIKRGEDFLPATIRNISSGGLQVEGDSLPAIGSYVSLFVDGLSMPSGEIAWRKGKRAGIELMEELSWATIMPWIREQLRRASN